ncbi:hypothetical protein FPOAC1_003102 [Fusarium poae]|uniref:hypothetical protein n=1 Tax=Fusarium poae TaxID=36050 RepID=UPI001CE9F8B3|nr:hypothetical protein FPOAC1_003102 [Fusarium poae]KAG8677091.1 hypothetical protein FPOAC1_003102 [Fusarium poae]
MVKASRQVGRANRWQTEVRITPAVRHIKSALFPKYLYQRNNPVRSVVGSVTTSESPLLHLLRFSINSLTHRDASLQRRFVYASRSDPHAHTRTVPL